MVICDVVIGSYRIIKEIGCGGMATVYEAEHVLLPRRAAIKVMHADLVKQRDLARRMIDEASILDDVRHAGVVRVFDCDVLPDGRAWIAMELVEGETLAAMLQDSGILPAREVARLLADAADVLTAVHASGVVHRDLKPANLIASSDRTRPWRVIDWGIARLGPERRVTAEGMTPGTPIYMSPEQSAGEHIAGPCDVYSLGVVAYEALCGRPPFDGRTLTEVVCMHRGGKPAALSDRCAAPRGLCNLVHRMLEKDAADRPSTLEVHDTARALERELAAVAGGGTIYIERDVTMFREPRWTPAIPHANANAMLARPRPIVPRSRNDQVNGEFKGK